MDDMSALVKRLRKRLGLTQEQFAHKLGVTFSTVNQWENRRRQPQPFLRKHLLEMEASLAAGVTGHLTKAGALAFKRRWAAVNAAEREELASTPMAHKFRQLGVLLAMARRFGWTAATEAEEDLVRERWARLRRVMHA